MTSPASAFEKVDHTSKITTTLQKHSPGMQTLLNLHHVLMIAAQNDTDGAETWSTPTNPTNQLPIQCANNNKQVNEMDSNYCI